MCSDCEAYGLKNTGLTRSDCIPELFIVYTGRPRLSEQLGAH